MSSSEKSSLLPSNASGSGPSYYFLQSENNHDAKDLDGGEEIDALPPGATEDEFASRPVGTPRAGRKTVAAPPPPQQANGLWEKIFGRKPQDSQRPYGEVGTLVRERKVPVKIEPKVFFANERTFLAWLHVSIVLAGASVAIVAFADTNPWSQLYGIILLPVAISFILYSMYQYAKRAAMIRRKDPGPYEDTVGPTVLGIMLMLSITAQFALKVYSMM